MNNSGSTTELTVEDRSAPLGRGGIPPEAMILIPEDNGNLPQVLIGAEKLDLEIDNRTRRTFWSDQGEAGVMSDASDKQ